MKLQRRNKLTTGIIMAILLQCGVGYTIVQGATTVDPIIINNNDGTGIQPVSANTMINITNSAAANTEQSFIGVHTSGTTAVTNVALLGIQQINIGGDDATAITHAYGIYNEDGAQTTWVSSDTSSPSLSVSATGYKADNYGIYNSGSNSRLTVASDNGNELLLSVSGNSNASDADSSEVLPEYPPLMNNIAILGDTGAITNIKASSIAATGRGSYNFVQGGVHLYNQTVLEELNTTIANAAEAYATVVDNYETYTDQDSYMEDLSKAQATVDAAINSYKAVAGGWYTVGVASDNGAQNTVTAEGAISAANDSATINQSVDATASDSALITKNVAIGIYGNNGAQNKIIADGGISTTATTQLNFTVNGGSANIGRSITAAHALEVVGVAGENNSKNEVMLAGSDLTTSGIIYFPKEMSLEDGISLTQTDMEVNGIHVSGVYGDGGAQNIIVDAGDINTSLRLSNYGANIRAAQNTNYKINSNTSNSVNVTGIEGHNGTSSNITADSIATQMFSDSINDTITVDTTSNPVSDTSVNAVIAREGAFNTRAVASDTGAYSKIATTSESGIQAILSGLSSSINDVMNDSNTPTPATNLNAEINHTLTGSVNVQGIYANSSAVNKIEAPSISATITEQFSPGATINDYISVNNANQTIKQSYNWMTNVQGVYANNSAQNLVITEDISAQLQMLYPSLSDNISNSVADTNIAVEKALTIPIVMQGVYSNNSGSNVISAQNITASLDNFQMGTNYIQLGNNALNNSSINFTSITNMPISIQGIYGSNRATNTINIGDTISALLKNTNTNFNYNIAETPSADNGGSNVNLTADSTYNIPVTVQGIGGDNLAFNHVVASDIVAGIEQFSTNHAISTQYSSENLDRLDTMDSTIAINMPITVQGVYSSNGATNQVYGSSSIVALLQMLQVGFSSAISDTPDTPDNNSIITTTGTYTMPIKVQGISGNNGGINKVVTPLLSAQVQSANISNNNLSLNMDNASNSAYTLYSVPITVQGVSGSAQAVNAVKAGTIYADVGNGNPLNISGQQSISGNGTNTILEDFPIYVAGIHGDTNAVNDITTETIQATSTVYQQYMVANQEQTTLPASVDVFGIYGAGQSKTSLHSIDENGVVNIAVGIGYNLDGSATIDTSNLHTYGLYLDDATVNLYNNVNVTGDTVWTDSSGNTNSTAINLIPVTYLNNANINFLGYGNIYTNSYYDPYYYDDATSTYGKTMATNEDFHTYTSTSSGGMLELQGTNNFTVHTDLVNDKSDKLLFDAWSKDSTGTNYISVATDASILKNTKGRITGKTVVIGVTDAGDAITNASGNTFTFNNKDGISTDVSFYGKTFSSEGVLRKYIVTPTVETEDAGTSKNVIITAIDYDTSSPSEGMMTANDSQLAMRNAWMVENDTLMHRMGDLRMSQSEERGIWAKFDRGKMDSNSSYGRSFGQTYNQLYFGYDKQHMWDGGKLYTGFAVDHLTSNVNYERGSGSVKSTMLTLYGTWMGDKGHYLDVVAKGGRISSEYSVTDSNNNLVSASYGAPAYSLSAEYGYRKELSNKYFIEPQVQLTLGHISGVNYQQSNGTNIYQSNVNSAVGRIGVIGGRNLGDKGNAYVKASVLHSFGGSGTVIGSYGNDSLAVDTVSGHSTWVELGAGANVRITENSNIYFDVSRTFGGNVTQKWQFNIGSRLKF